ncbi:flagellar basal body P-ring protein FlgI [Paludisphaera rhizosphaerae]|uniref:flagellar basal body P-ring protein FlgI n=1 Tax=Paludisphaera rhizosphaerae TaxID=2711216 RepID=UPI0013EE3A32|nr:flagellar basal body P-ring protein FlgI [Paludisphaera rhizosphaerae]
MRRTVPRRSWAVGALVAVTALGLGRAVIGAGPLPTAASKKAKAQDKAAPKIEEAVGDLAYVFENGETTVEGVGLVSNLDGTGGDAPPSWQREQLVDDMNKAGIDHPSKLLESKQYAMVIVRMKIPTGGSPRDRFDVDLELPPASSVKSLAGGYLMFTRLREVLHTGGGPKQGTDLATAIGPVMIGDAKDPNNPKAGRVLGGGRVKKEHPFKLILKDDRRFIRNAKMVESVVNERFHQNEHGQQKGASTAKTDTFLELRVPAVYHQNQQRYFRVVQLLPMVDTPQLREQRLKATAAELLDPKTSGMAALKLECFGPSAAPALEAGLKSEDAHVRFFSAEALAYLDQSSGVETLGKTAIELKQYRAYALAALAAMEDPAARAKLRHLMDEPDIEVRYGAFNALRTLDPTDAMLGQVRILDEPPRDEMEEDNGGDGMTALIQSRRARPDDPFSLYMVESDGAPVIHVSRSRRSEIVLFGRAQNILPPLVLGEGDILLNAADHDDGVDISKIVPSRFGSEMKVRSSLDLGDVIRQVARLGATYPEVVAILEAAERQKNLPGALFVDSVPKANMQYLSKALMGKDEMPKADSEVKPASGSFIRRMFTRGRGDSEPTKTADKSAQKSSSKDDDVASDADGDKISAKKDDALKRTSGESAEASESEGDRRPRLLDVFRRRND